MTTRRKFVYIECSEIPRKVVEVVRSHYEKMGIRVDDALILEKARDEYDKHYLQPNGEYKHETDWRKVVIEQGDDPEELSLGFRNHLEEHYEKLKATDPVTYQKQMDDMEHYLTEVRKLRESRQIRYRELHGISEKERLSHLEQSTP